MNSNPPRAACSGPAYKQSDNTNNTNTNTLNTTTTNNTDNTHTNSHKKKSSVCCV